MEENEGKNLAAEKKIENFEKELKELISQINEEKSRIVCGNVAIDVEKRDDKFECFIGGHKIITCKDGEVSYNIQELEQLYKEIEKVNNEDRPIPDLLESMGLPKLDDLKDYEEKRKNEKQRNGANHDKKEEAERAKEQEEPEKDDDKDIDDEKEPQNKTRGLQELNLGVLILINPALRQCSKAYLDPNTNSLVFKDKFGKEHGPEEYGFTELQTATGNFELSKMHDDGEITSHENPTKVYAIKGSNYGISTDFGVHHREVNLVVRDREHGHENSYSIINGNLTIGDSGIISEYRARELSGIKEGIYGRGEVDEANETARNVLEKQDSSVREKFQEGFIEERRENDRINGIDDLKRAIAEVLEEEYHEEPEDAMEIASEIVDKSKSYEDIKSERNELRKESNREQGGRDIGEEALERLWGKR